MGAHPDGYAAEGQADTAERGWLSAYHTAVLERIGSHLSEAGLAWAKQA